MNLVIVNENVGVINSLNIDIIKVLNGIYDVDMLKEELVNFYFNKVIIDITAIKNYFSSYDLFEFLNYFGSDKVILLLNDSEYCGSNEFLSKLVSNGYYNFSRNTEGISYLINRSNSYDDVKKYLVVSNSFQSELNSSAQYKINIDKNIKIIGIQNLSSGAGATTLMVMMVKQLSYNYRVKGIEVNGHDSIYFRNENIIFCTSMLDVQDRIKELRNVDAVIIDLNGVTDKENICDDIIYLLEPGVVRLGKTMVLNNQTGLIKKDYKIVLNRSALRDDEIDYFSRETGLDVYYNLGNIDDKKDRLLSIDKLLIKLGFDKQSSRRGIF